MADKVKVTVAGSNLAFKLNQIYGELREEERLSANVRRIKSLLETKLWVLDAALIAYLMVLTLLEKPQWCVARGAAMTDDCQEDVYGNKYYLINVLQFTNKKVFLYTALIMLYFNVKYYIMFSSLRSTQEAGFFRSHRRVRLVALTVLNVLHFLFFFLIKDNVIRVDGPTLVRTFAIIMIVDWLYYTLHKVVVYLLNFYEVFLFFLLDWAVVAAAVEVLFVSFDRYYDHKSFYSFNFTNYFKSLFSVFVFFTTNNSPEIVVHDFSSNRFLTPLFLTLVFVNNLFLIALLVGLSYYKMKLTMANEIREVAADPVKLTVYNKLLEHPEASRLLIRRMLVLEKQGRPTTFVEMDRVLQEEQAGAFVKTRASEHIFALLKSLKSYELVYALIDLLIAAFALYVIHTKAFDRYHYFLFSILLCAVVLLDFLHHSFFHDIWNFDLTWKTILDAVLSVVVVILALTIIANEGKSVILVKFWAFFCVVKCFRFFILYFRFNRHSVKGTVIYPFLRFVYDVVRQLVLLFFVFACLGFNIFGGNINSHSIEYYNTELGREFDISAINLNTFVNSLMYFVVISMNNDWPVLANISVVSGGENRRLMKFMFVFFKVYVNYVLLNSVIAFILEILQNYARARKSSADPEQDELLEIMDDTLFKNIDKPIET